MTWEVSENDKEALKLRRGGLTYRQIACRLGYQDAIAARDAVARALLAMKMDKA